MAILKFERICSATVTLSCLIATVAGGVLPRTGWTVTASSQQTPTGNEATKALDGNAASFWHSQYDPLINLPHNITIDMQNTYLVNGFRYQPRNGASNNGNIGQHNILVSTDGITYTTISSGTWANDKIVKQTDFTNVPARYVRLMAITEAQGTGKQWASAAELNVLSGQNPYLNRDNWAVSADSEQIPAGGQLQPATAAIDGSETTYWHTNYAKRYALPHYFNIDLKSATAVAGLTYLPRPLSTGGNGRIGQYEIQSSVDSATWVTVATGTWADDEKLKRAEFPTKSARYFRLKAVSEAGNRGPWTSASEINLIDGGSKTALYTVTADSFQATNPPQSAIDGNPATFWHTPFNPKASTTNYPHFFQIDMGDVFGVSALTYVPRQDGSPNGNIGKHSIQVSMTCAANSWKTVASGTFLDDQSAKVVKFDEVPARCVKLIATSEAGGRGNWASASDFSLTFVADYTPSPKTMGAWGYTIDFPIVPVAAAVVFDSGKILTWSSYKANQFSGSGGLAGLTATATYDPSDQTVSQRFVAETKHDMFCPGLAIDFKGRPVVNGGNSQDKTSIYDTVTDQWIIGAPMQKPRGYQASATLSNGRVFTIGGSWSGGRGGKDGEYYDPTTNTTVGLPGCDVTKMLTDDKQGVYRSDNHGWLFGWKNGYIFQAGPSKQMNWFGTTGQGSTTAAGFRANDGHSMNGIAVMYDAPAGKIFTAGGAADYSDIEATNNAHIITIGNTLDPQPDVQTKTSMTYKRAFHNGVALPDGKIFVVGGQSYPVPFTDDTSIFVPELYNPETDTWAIMDKMAVPRTYHSVALLMPDATVFVGGGGLCAGCSQNHFNAEIFQPPYLFTASGDLATRPVINTVSSGTVKLGMNIIVNTNGPVTKFALIRYGSATHTVDTDQRRIPLTPVGAGNIYTITVPNDAGIAIPGPWMLFALDANGIPSVSKSIMITL